MTQQLKYWRDQPPPEWGQWVGQADATIFQSSAWAAYQQAVEPCEPVYLMYYHPSGDKLAGGMAFLKKSRVPLLNHVTKELVFPAHPFFYKNSDKPFSKEFFQECGKVAKAMGCCRIILNSFYSGRSPLDLLEAGFDETKRWEFILDLQQESDQIWSGIGKDHREKIKKFQKNGFEVIVGKTKDDLQYLKQLRESTQGKRAEKGQEYDLPLEASYYDQLYHLLVKPDFARLFLAVRDQEAVAGILFLTLNRKAYSIFSGSNEIGYKFGAQSGLFWEAVQNFQSHHFEELNRGGISFEAESPEDPLHGIYLFKKRLGTIPVLCRSGVKVIAPFQYYLREKVMELRKRFETART